LNILWGILLLGFRTAFFVALFFCVFSLFSGMPSIPGTDTLVFRYSVMIIFFLGLLLWLLSLRGSEFLRRVTHLKLALWSWPQAVAIGLPLSLWFFLAPHYCLLMLILGLEIILITIGGCLRSGSTSPGTDSLLTMQDDTLDRAAYVNFLYRAILSDKSNDEENSILGNNGCASFLFGRNGLGKTFVLRLVASKLLERDRRSSKTDLKTRVVWFNPWKYSSEHDVMVGFFKSITDALSRDHFIHDLNGLPAEFVALMDGATSQMSFLDMLTKPLLAILGSQQNFDVLAETVNRYAKILNIKVVVFVDDLDRCRPEIRQVLFQLLNHADSAALRACVHVVIAASAEELFAKEAVGMTKTEVALERYIQQAIHLPEMTFEGKLALVAPKFADWKFGESPRTKAEIEFWNTVSRRDSVLRVVFGLLETPRQIKAFWERIDLKLTFNEYPPTINWVSLICATAIEVARPNAHEWIIRNQALILKKPEASLEEVNSILKPDPNLKEVLDVLFLRDCLDAPSKYMLKMCYNLAFHMDADIVFNAFYSMRALPYLVTYQGIVDFQKSSEEKSDVEFVEKAIDAFVSNYGDDAEYLGYLLFWIETIFAEKLGAVAWRIALFFAILKAYSQHGGINRVYGSGVYPVSQIWGESFYQGLLGRTDAESFLDRLFLSVLCFEENEAENNQEVAHQIFQRIWKEPGLSYLLRFAFMEKLMHRRFDKYLESKDELRIYGVIWKSVYEDIGPEVTQDFSQKAAIRFKSGLSGIESRQTLHLYFDIWRFFAKTDAFSYLFEYIQNNEEASILGATVIRHYPKFQQDEDKDLFEMIKAMPGLEAKLKRIRGEYSPSPV